VARLLPVRDVVVTHAACNLIQTCTCNSRRQPTPASLATSDLHTPISPCPPVPVPALLVGWGGQSQAQALVWPGPSLKIHSVPPNKAATPPSKLHPHPEARTCPDFSNQTSPLRPMLPNRLRPLIAR
jgi:hypothetical protein